MNLPHTWTAADDAALAAGYRRGDSGPTIARRIGVDLTAVHNRARKLGIRHRSQTRSLAERFFDRVSPEPNSGCWLWDGAADEYGYGRLRVPGEGWVQASRLALVLAGKPAAPLGAQIYRRCANPACVNPEHLSAGHNSAIPTADRAGGRRTRLGRGLGQ